MSEQYQPLKVLVNNEYVELPDDAVYDINEQEIIRQTPATTSLSKLAVPKVIEWGPKNLREENRNRPEIDPPEGLTYSA
jgi:hypothetical protein